MSRILKILLFILGIILFFEIGLFASYTLISSEPINPLDLLSVQLDEGSDLVSSVTGEKKLNDQDTLNITNSESVALVLNNLTNLSVNLNSVSAKISNDDTGNQTITITALATKDTQITSGGYIQILPEQTYSITATAIGEVYSSGKVRVNTTSITLKERIVLYNQNGNSNTNQSIESLMNYTNNKTNDNNKNVTSASNNQQKTRA
ncbi:hypothetical protein [Methanosphaera sp.]|uniref:hypothetical protein n=1 Tax=Methanosphaera sp. TaxID=2666342 RepID=UPI0025E19F8C|nr:hypothetical protein [Methanosphaera sp.]MEE1116864.1 hypothetical protein [Methanosphaera sp.]MEE3324120.1 hypothetical protein [Methanosphaera sp.]MEE3418268.1 hypothetical protein [Methanosphaera sp.]